MPIYLMTEEGDRNHLDRNTREKMVSDDIDVHFGRLLKAGWLILGLILGSSLHDMFFHAIEQVMK